MNSILGKSTGIALLLAAGLLAALFAMGVFSATGVGAHDKDTDHGDTDNHRHAVLTGLAIVGAETFTRADGTAYDSADLATVSTWAVDVKRDDVQLEVTPEGNQTGTKVVISWNDESVTLSETVAAATVSLTDDVVGEIKIVVSDSTPEDNGTTGGGSNFLTTTYTIKLNHDDSPSTSDEAGAAVGITLKVNGEVAAGAGLAASPADEITIDFGDAFGVPTGIDPDDVSINGLRASDVWVDDGVVTASWDDFDLSNDTPSLLGNGPAQIHTIRIRRAAGITNPTEAGAYGIKVGDDPEGAGGTDEADPKVEAQNVATIVRSVSVKPKSGASGDDVTITGKGFSGGSATVFIDMPGHTDDSEDTNKADITTDAMQPFTLVDGKLVAGTGDADTNGDEADTPTAYGESYDSDQDVQLGVAAIVDGSFTLTTTVDSRFSKDALGQIRINANDGSGLQAVAPEYDAVEDPTDSNDAVFSVDSSISVSPEEVSLAKELTITLSDWPDADAKITEVTIGGGSDALSTNVSIEDGDAIVKITVPSNTNIGTQRVVVKDDSGNSKSINVEVKALELTVTPSAAVNRQQITVQGGGFGDRQEIETIEIGSISVTVPADTDSSSAGNVVITLTVPEDVGAGTHTVTVIDASGRTGTVELTVPTPAITLDPATSRRGTPVSITGTGFPANDLILISYPEGSSDRTVGTGQTDTTGNFTATFNVPSFATIGGSAKVKATSSVNDVDRSASADHSLPDSVLSVEPAEVASGSRVSIKGENMAVFASISDLTIGGVEVTTVPAPSTDANGSFETSVLVPQLELGNQQVSVMVGTRTSTTFVEIVVQTAAAVTDPADVFEPLADRLVRVWYLDRATQTWSFYDPDPDVAAFNTLTEVASGQSVSIIITAGANVGFQGMTLYPGTNPIPLK